MRRQPPTGRKLQLGLVIGVLLVAAYFRLYRLDELPPGLAPDIAFNGLDARDVLAGHLPVFFPRNYGREALFIYFQTLILAGGGFTRFSFSYSGVALDMLAIATTYRVWRELFGFRVGLLAALFLGVFMWDVNMSRLGFRVSSLLPLLNATVYLLWRLVHMGERKYALLGGLTLGLCLYTYTSARLVPVLVAACCVCSWRLARKRLPLLGLAALTAAVVALPEGAYFLRHPAEFTMRTVDVSLYEARPGGGGESVGTAILRSLGMFFVRGDINPTYNLIGRPVLERWEGVLFVLGLAFALAWMWRSAAARWSLSWLVVMLAPAALSIDSPNSMRALGAAPVVFLLPALAVEGAARASRKAPLVFAVLALPIAGVAAAHEFDAYFRQRAQDADSYGGVYASRFHMAQFVANRPETRIYFADSDITGHVVRMFVPTTHQDGWQPEASAAIPIPSRIEGDTLYVGVLHAALDQIGPEWLPNVHVWPQALNPLNQPDFVAFSWSRQDAEGFLDRMTSVGQPLGSDFEVGAYASSRTADGLMIYALWQPLAPSGPYDMYVHLLDGSGRQVGQSDRLVWPVRDFRAASEGLGPVLRGYFDEGRETDDRLLTRHEFKVPAGQYAAEIGLAHRDPQNPANITAAVGSVRVLVRAD